MHYDAMNKTIGALVFVAQKQIFFSFFSNPLSIRCTIRLDTCRKTQISAALHEASFS